MFTAFTGLWMAGGHATPAEVLRTRMRREKQQLEPINIPDADGQGPCNSCGCGCLSNTSPICGRFLDGCRSFQTLSGEFFVFVSFQNPAPKAVRTASVPGEHRPWSVGHPGSTARLAAGRTDQHR